MRDPLHIGIQAITKRINRALRPDTCLRPTRWASGRDATWYIWALRHDGGIDENCIPLGPYLPSQLVTIALACGALKPFERNRVVLNARGAVVPTLAPWDGTNLFPEPIEPSAATATVTSVAPFAPASERIETGLTGPESDPQSESPDSQKVEHGD